MATSDLIRPSSFLAPSTVSIQGLLSSGQFVIPEYQRDFAWTDEEIKALWDDLVATANNAFTAAGQAVANPRPHFIGAVVLQVFDAQLGKSPEVMDGQQRLVTLTALISVLIEFVGKIQDQKERTGWDQSLRQLVATFVGGAARPRVRLSRGDQHYQALVCEHYNSAEREQYVQQAQQVDVVVREKLSACVTLLHQCVVNYLAPIAAADQDRRLIELVRSITQLTIVLRMDVQEDGVAYDVFESLNARGLELQQADLIKNKLYALAQQQQTGNQVKAAWEKVQRAIEQQQMISLTEFFFFHFVAKHKEIKHHNLYDEIARYLKIPANTALAYANDVAKSAEDFQQVIDGGAALSAEVVRDVEAIRDILSNKYALTLLIAGLHNYGATSAEFAEVVRLAHHFVFRRFHVEGTKLGAYSTEISDLARKVTIRQLADTAALATALRAISTDATFTAKLKEFSPINNSVGFYAIEMIENHLAGGAGITIQRQSPSQHLEHIMPRKPGNGWPHVSAKAEYKDWVNRLGNMLALEADINRHVKNKDFATKSSNQNKKDYANSKLKLPHTLAPYLTNGAWDFLSIQKRQADLATNYATAVWGL